MFFGALFFRDREGRRNFRRHEKTKKTTKKLPNLSHEVAGKHI